MGGSWIPLSRIVNVVSAELFVLLLAMTLVSYVILRVFLRDLNPERRELMRELMSNLYAHIVNLSVLFLLFEAFLPLDDGYHIVQRILPYLGFVATIFGAVVFIKIMRVLLFEFLFWGHKTEGVPVLLVNLMTLVLSMVIVIWLASHLFQIQLTPLLATSAILSVVLGLALQETLGNLFAAIALQLDKPYEIGDWLEVWGGSMKWTGQVYEISWRATTLLGWADELIIIPNRVMTQSQISNFTRTGRPIIRSQNLRLPIGVDLAVARPAAVEGALKVEGVCTNPLPIAMAMEVTESWINLKLIYYIKDYGSQYTIGDRVIASVLGALEQRQIQIAATRVEISKEL